MQAVSEATRAFDSEHVTERAYAVYNILEVIETLDLKPKRETRHGGFPPRPHLGFEYVGPLGADDRCNIARESDPVKRIDLNRDGKENVGA